MNSSHPSSTRAGILALQLVALATASALVGCSAPQSVTASPQPQFQALASQTTTVLPTPAKLTAKIKKVSTRGIGSVSVVVTTPGGTVLANPWGSKNLIPASTMKLLTTMAAVDTLGATRTFSTRTVYAGHSKVILVGGGDPMLTLKTSTSVYKKASLQRLAASTAKALKRAKRTSVSLGYDASLFSGPSFSSKWKAKWRTYEARVAALEVNGGKVSGGKAATNPALTAAKAFASRLKKLGISVTSIAAKKAASGNRELARVTSAPLAKIIKTTLLDSNNLAAETMLRQIAVKTGRAGSFTGGSAAVKAWLRAKGLWVSGQVILDGSGLSPSNRLNTAVLAAAMRTALADSTFAPVIAGLPVAGVSGTLKTRFNDASERIGRRNVHAKTGTLTGVAGLVGYLTTTDGARLVFAELANRSKSTTTAYNWLDRTAAAVIRCGCR